MTATYIYFLKPKKRPGPIKVGCSAVPQARLEVFMAWSPFPLEIIGKVPGTIKDEGFFHRCFADCHSHGEWFRASPRLLETITALIAAGNVDTLRTTLTELGSIRKKRRPPTAGQKVCRSLGMKVDWQERKLRGVMSVDSAWHSPDDVYQIIYRWRRAGAECNPQPEDVARIQEYLSDPAKHSVVPSWCGPKVAA